MVLYLCNTLYNWKQDKCVHVCQSICCLGRSCIFVHVHVIAVYIDSLVMISIEKSETNKKEHWKSETNLSQTMANAKSMAKIWYKFHGPRQI